MRTASLRTKHFWLLVAFFSVLSSPVLAELTITDNWVLQSKTRVSRTVFEYVYKAELSNTGAAAANVTATITSSAPATTIVDGDLDFGDVAAGETVTSLDTFAIRQDRSVAFDPASVQWEISSASPDGTLPLTKADEAETYNMLGPNVVGHEGVDANGNVITTYLTGNTLSPGLSIIEDAQDFPDAELQSGWRFITNGFIKIKYPHDPYYNKSSTFQWTKIRVEFSERPARVFVIEGDEGRVAPWTTSEDEKAAIFRVSPRNDEVIFALIAKD